MLGRWSTCMSGRWSTCISGRWSTCRSGIWITYIVADGVSVCQVYLPICHVDGVPVC